MTLPLPTVVVTGFPAKDNPVRLTLYANDDLTNLVIVPDLEDQFIIATVGRNMLDALGNRSDISGGLSRVQDLVAAVPRWLIAHRTQHVVLISPQHLQDEGLHTAVQMAASAGASLILATQERSVAALLARLQAWDAQQVAIHDVELALEHATASRVPTAREPDRPAPHPLPNHLPEADFYAFRDLCRRTLSDADFAAVDSLYQQARRAAFELAASGPPEHPEVFQLMDKLLTGRPGAPDRVAVLRGVQAGCFQRGVLVQVNLGRFQERVTNVSLEQTTPATWRSLRAYANTERAAVIALALHGLDASAIRALTLADIVAENTHRWHPDARPYLVAHYLTRLGQHAADDAPYMIIPPRSYGIRLREAATDLGIAVGGTGYRTERRNSITSVEGIRILNLNDDSKRVRRGKKSSV